MNNALFSSNAVFVLRYVIDNKNNCDDNIDMFVIF